MPITVGWMSITVEVCTDGTSFRASSASVDHDTTGPGDAAGFDIKLSAATRTSLTTGGFGGGETGFTTNGTLRDCLPYVLTFCSDGEDFMVHVHVDMLNGIVVSTGGNSSEMVVHGRVFKFTYTHKCTNKVCGVKLS